MFIIDYSSSNDLEVSPKLRFKDENGNNYSEWKKITIKDALKYEQPQRYIIKTENYNNSYPIPVLTANKAFILGYTNEMEDVYNNGDTIIYDDFTMDIKFVKFNFKVKSSAIKILTSKDGFNLFFIFCLLKYLNLKPQGHQRSYISILEPMKVWTPTFKEQQKIAAFLSLIDQRIEKQHQLIENLKKYKRGLFNYIYCNKSINWEKKSIKEFSAVYGGYAFDSKLYDKKGSYKILTIGNVTGKRYISIDCNHIKDIPFDLQKHQYLKNGDIVISMTGNVGRVSLVNTDNCLLNQRVAKIIIKDIYLKEYIYQVLSSSSFEQEMNNKGQGAAQKNIKNSDIENFIFYTPKDKNRINEISNTLYCLDSLIEQNDSILDKLILIKNGLLQQMFI